MKGKMFFCSVVLAGLGVFFGQADVAKKEVKTLILESGVDKEVTVIGVKLCAQRSESDYDRAVWQEIVVKTLNCIGLCQNPHIKDEEVLYLFSRLVEELYYLIKSDKEITGYFSVYCGSHEDELQNESKFNRTYGGILEDQGLDKIDINNIDHGSFVFEIKREAECDDQAWADAFKVVSRSLDQLQYCSNETQYANMLQSANIIKSLYTAAQINDFIRGEIRFYGNDITVVKEGDGRERQEI